MISKYSIITGLSGIGKTQFYNYVLNNDSPFVTRECELPVITATSENINAIFDVNNRMELSVVFVDELLLKQHKMSEKLINQSPHLILSIGRDIPFIGYAPLDSIFTIERDDDWFKLFRMKDIDHLPINKKFVDYDYASFEEMLFTSEFVHGTTDKSPFDFITLERFYEIVLQDNTQDTPLFYQHGKPLTKCYLKECSSCNDCGYKCGEKYKCIVGKDSGLLKIIEK